MFAVPHPEVLAPEFVPPVLLHRATELARVADGLASRVGSAATAAAIVSGPSGSGTSAVARLAARRKVEELHRERPRDPLPLLATVRVRWCRGAQSVAGALLQHLDEGFRPEGFATNEILAGFVRRLRRERRAGVVVLDDVGRSAPDLTAILRAFLHPDRFLPEGVDDPPQLWLVLGGAVEAKAAWDQAERAGLGESCRVSLRPYAAPALEAILRDRLERALGRTAPEGLARELSARAISEVGGATRAMELLRRRLLGPEMASGRPLRLGATVTGPLRLEPHFVEAIDRAVGGASAPLGEVRAWEARLARREGRRPLPVTTMWRRLLRLESMGLVRRSVRPGGAGGTRSTLELLTPVSDWPVRPARAETLPAAGSV